MSWLDFVTEAQLERFEAKIERPDGMDGCWLWTGATKVGGYGTLAITVHRQRRQVQAHRFSLMRKIGRELERGELATHSCDTPACVNPAHLFVGDATSNVREKFQRDRSGYPMTFERAEELRAAEAAGEPRGALAERYRISVSAVALIVNGKRWSPECPAHQEEDAA